MVLTGFTAHVLWRAGCPASKTRRSRGWETGDLSRAEGSPRQSLQLLGLLKPDSADGGVLGLPP